MRYLQFVFLLSNYAIAVTLTRTETHIILTQTPEPTSNSDIYVTTTVFAHQSQLGNHFNGYGRGGIDLIPVSQPEKKDESIHVGYDVSYFEDHLAEPNEVKAFSPYHLAPGYRGSNSKEEMAKQTRIEATKPLGTPSPSSENFQFLDFPSKIYQVDGTPFNYDELSEQSFWKSPHIDDNEIHQSLLKWEKLSGTYRLETKEPFRGLEPGEKLKLPRNKIMKSIPRPGIAPTTLSFSSSTPTSQSTSFTSTSSPSPTSSTSSASTPTETGKSDGGFHELQNGVNLASERRIKLQKLKQRLQSKGKNGSKDFLRKKKIKSSDSRRKVIHKNWANSNKMQFSWILGIITTIAAILH